MIDNLVQCDKNVGKKCVIHVNMNWYCVLFRIFDTDFHRVNSLYRYFDSTFVTRVTHTHTNAIGDDFRVPIHVIMINIQSACSDQYSVSNKFFTESVLCVVGAN